MEVDYSYIRLPLRSGEASGTIGSSLTLAVICNFVVLNFDHNGSEVSGYFVFPVAPL